MNTIFLRARCLIRQNKHETSKLFVCCANTYWPPCIDQVFIAAGTANILNAKSEQIAFVESIIPHKSYNPRFQHKLDNDIAILKLKTHLIFNDVVQSACLPDTSFQPEGIAVASGWGLIGQNPSLSTEDLKVSI